MQAGGKAAIAEANGLGRARIMRRHDAAAAAASSSQRFAMPSPNDLRRGRDRESSKRRGAPGGGIWWRWSTTSKDAKMRMTARRIKKLRVTRKETDN